MGETKKYWAFLSYSHQDARLCEWLHRELETFRVPSRLVGKASRDGKTPSRLFPVFRDRDELPGSSELGKNLADALAESRYLIVICSPAAARSRWVNEEIRQFKAMGGENRVLALIVDGEPNAADTPDSGLLECFPEALKHRVAEDGSLLAERVEPIAADIRRGKENRSMALLRLIAGVLGLPFDELRQRDRERQRSTLKLRAAVGLALTVLLVSAAHWKYRALRMERLEALGRDAMMQSKPTQAAVYLAETYRLGNDKRNVKIMLDQAMRSVDMLSTIHTEDAQGFSNAMFSDDGTRLLATSKSGHVSVWRADNGQTLLRLKADSSINRYARFLPGGREIALLYQDGRVEVIEAKTGRALRNAQLPKGYVPNLESVHPHLATYTQTGGPSEFGSAIVFDLRTLQPVREISRACAAPLSLVSPDGKSYLCVAMDGPLSGLFIVPLDSSAAPKHLLTGMEIRRIRVAGNSEVAVAGAADGTLKVVSLRSQKTLLSLRDPAGGIPDLALSPDGKLLAVAGETGTVLVWSVASGELVATMAAHTSRIKGVHFLGDSQRLATLGYDGALKLWNLANATLMGAAEPGQGYLVRSALTLDGERMATFADARADLAGENIDPALKVWDLLAPVPLETFGSGRAVVDSEITPHKSAVIFRGDPTSSVWDVRSGQKVYESTEKLRWPISANDDGTLITTDHGVIDVASGKSVLSFKGHSSAPRGVWSHDGKTVASVSDDLIQVWDLHRQAVKARVVPSAGRTAVALSANGARLLVVSAQGAQLFDTQTGNNMAQLKENLSATADVEASLDGKVFRVKTLNAIVEIDVNTAAVVQRHANVSRFGTLSGCQDRIRLNSRADNSMVVTSLNGSMPPVTLYGHTGLLNAIDCDADMQLFLTGGTHGDAILWNAKTAEPILRWTGHQKNVGGVAFLAEPGQFVTAGSDGIFQKWTFGEEKRHPQTVARRVACRVPLILDGYALKPHQLDRNACRQERVW